MKDRNFDGMIITGAPVENMPFEEVKYWKELTEIIDFAEDHVTSTIYICWGAQAGLYHFYGVPKYDAEPGAASGAATSKPTSAAKPSGMKKAVKAKDAAKAFGNSFAGTYKVTASSLNVRHGAGTDKAIMVAIPKGTVVKCYGYYTSAVGVKWLYVQFEHQNVTYTGFCSSKYLSVA